MSEQHVQQTKYISEEVWRRSLAVQFENLRLLSGHPAKEVQQIHRRIARIKAGGLPEWKARYDAAPGESD